MARQKFIEVSKSVFTDPDYKTAFNELGLTSIDAVFSFKAGKNLVKSSLARYRSRLQFEANSPPTTLFLKRYDSPPIPVQLKKWLTACRRRSCSSFDFEPANKLASLGINTPKTISYGEQWGIFFEKRSFIITEKIPNAECLERKLPAYFNSPATVENLKLRRNFIAQLATFVKKFHETGFRHRDLYFAHIFYNERGEFYLIDLARAFKPTFFAQRFRIKDIAQLYYSAPGRHFSRTDRLRFYLEYTNECHSRESGNLHYNHIPFMDSCLRRNDTRSSRRKLTRKDKTFISKVVNKARRMARHDIKHGRRVPFANGNW